MKKIRLSKNVLRAENIDISSWIKDPATNTYSISPDIKKQYSDQIWQIFCEYARAIGFSLYDTKNNVINQYTQELLIDNNITDEILKKMEEILSRNLGEINE